MESLGLYDYEVKQGYIPAGKLSQFGTIEQTDFKKQVYEIHRQNASSNNKRFVGSLPEKELDYVYRNQKVKSIPLRKKAAEKCRLLLDAAKKALSEAKLGEPTRLLQISFWVQSGYRSAERQFRNWDSNFSRYYQETQKMRQSKNDGEHGIEAAKYLAKYIGRRLASPGYSLHNNGLAIDFVTIENGKKFGIKTSNTGELENAWRKTWFFGWLSKNASSFEFFQNNKINEPWHWEYRQASPVSMEVSISPSVTKQLLGETLYADIDLTTKNYPDKHHLTGIYIPPAFIRGSKAKANVIIYLHGYKHGYPKPAATIREYWDSKNFPLFAFREGLLESRKNAILAAPTLGPKSQAGKLVEMKESSGLDWYLRQILDHLQRRGIANEINEVVLTCHSGGGYPMLKWANGDNKSNIIEFWGFDCLYSGYDKKTTPWKKLFTQPIAWLNWAKKNPDKRLFIYYYNSTKEESKKLLYDNQKPKASNISVEMLDIPYARKKVEGKTRYNNSNIGPHFWVPITYWQDRLSQLPWS